MRLVSAGGLLALSAVLSLTSPVQARDLWESESGDRYVSLNSALKSVLLVSEPLYLDDGTTGTSFWRGRLDLEAALAEWLTAEVAYEHRLAISSDATGSGGQALLPPSGNLPYRFTPMGSAIIDEPTFQWEQGLDRLQMMARGDWGQATLGRQAIGFGRAQFFTVVDVLAPFGTFQVDQEWKAGVDAFDIEWQAINQLSLGFSAAAEEDFEDGAFLGRAMLNLGEVDALLIGGKRSEDAMLAVSSSMTLLDAEAHGEFGVFWTDGNGVADAQVGSRTVLKAVVGGSYTFDVLAGMTLLSEYHFNGFGLGDIEAEQAMLTDPAFLARLTRGDFQTIGQHEIAASLSLTVNELLRTYAYAVVSPQDGSGLAAVGGTYDASNALSLDLSAFAPWGASPDLSGGAPVLRSEYGASPFTVYLSMRFYD